MKNFEIKQLIAPNSAVDSSTVETLKAMRDSFNMTKQRCYNKECADYRFYGGRGIRICARWLECFDSFVDDMGLRPEGTTLERKDVNKDYCKDNCTWATRKEQTRNRRDTRVLTLEGVTKSMAEWAELTGIGLRTLHARKFKLGYTDKECLEKPVKFGVMREGTKPKPRKVSDYTAPAGFDCVNNKYTQEQVRKMQALYDADGQTFSSIGRLYGCSVTTASNICQKKKHYA